MGVDVDGHKSPGNATALIEAASKGHVAAVELLVAANAQVNLVDNGNCTALNAAAGDGYLDVVRALLNAGADKTIGMRGQNQGNNPMTMYDACSYKEHNKAAIFALLERTAGGGAAGR